MSDFRTWLFKQQDTDGPIGDLAHDTSGDHGFPAAPWQPCAVYLDYLKRYGGHVVEALHEAWSAWVKETRVLGDAGSYVYFVRAIDTGNVKIGLARDPWQRLSELQTGNASKLVRAASARRAGRTPGTPAPSSTLGTS